MSRFSWLKCHTSHLLHLPIIHEHFANKPNHRYFQVIIYQVIKIIEFFKLFVYFESNTYDAIESEGKQIWKFQRYGLVYDYFYKPVIFPPFTVFYYIYWVAKFITRVVRLFLVKEPIDISKKTRLKKIIMFFSRNIGAGFGK